MIKKLTNLIVVFLIGTLTTYAQILDNSLFRIYRGNTFANITQLRLNTDQTFELKVIEITCSLCNHNEVVNSINRIGKWSQSNDTIYLGKNLRVTIKNDSVLHPIDLIGLNLDSLPRERREQFERKYLDSEMNDFHLIYDTYPDGMARLIKDRYRFRRDEYEIELKENGTIEELRFYWDDKRKRRLKN